MRESGDVFSRYERIAAEHDALRVKNATSNPGKMPSMDHLSQGLFQALQMPGARNGDKDGRFWSNVHFARTTGFAGMAEYRENSQRSEEIFQMLCDAVERCESPIEKTLLPWLVYSNYGPELATFPVPVCLWKGSNALPATRIFIVPQFAFVKYRADFAIIAKHNGQTRIVAVECDGQEFHKARPDRERDSLFSVFGIETYRASGSDITKDAAGFSSRVAASFQEWARAL